ncbi:hypothetical protein AMTRI_Chr03g145740 [Amborella trichopoda]
MADCWPVLVQIVMQFLWAGNFLVNKMALTQGMSTHVFVAYRAAMATIALAPLTYFERKKRPPLDWRQAFQIFMLGLIGITVAQNCYIIGLYYTTPTFSATFINLIPVIISLVSMILKMDILDLRSKSGWAKIMGILVCVAGAMTITLYKGQSLNIFNHVRAPDSIAKFFSTPHSTDPSTDPSKKNWVLGPIFNVTCVIAWSVWVIYQAWAFKDYPAHASLSAMVCLCATVQSAIVALIFDKTKGWKLGWDIHLFTYAYSGILGSAMGILVQTWCIKKKGPIFAVIFNPVSTVVVVILEPILFRVKIHVGSLIGATLVILGLYSVLWAKAKERAKMQKEMGKMDNSTAQDGRKVAVNEIEDGGNGTVLCAPKERGKMDKMGNSMAQDGRKVELNEIDERNGTLAQHGAVEGDNKDDGIMEIG